ncbi:MAG: class III signal peptide-containing protein [Candidatus Omnitrophica bacterium]|nr:class III signal peptide-containing protein [Candidatus Omnitrophota bacterium]
MGQDESVVSRVTESQKFLLSVFYFVDKNEFNKVFKNGGGEEKMLKRKGQSTLEYVLILTAIIAAVIVVARAIGTNVQTSLTSVGTEMQKQAAKIKF